MGRHHFHNQYTDVLDTPAPSDFHEVNGYHKPRSPLDYSTLFETDRLVHTQFEDMVRNRPHSIALQFESSHQLTYQQLNRISNSVARQIYFSRGSIVLLALQRSPELIIAILAVLKAGATYVVLSTDSPGQRNQFIINDTRPSVAIVDFSIRDELQGVYAIQIEDLIEQSKGMREMHFTDLNLYQDSSDIAYIIYTSGTTGRPKGALLPHSAAFVGLAALPALENPETFRQLLCHSPNFSAAQRTILGTLCRGGTLCLASKENITLHLADTIRMMGISTLEITPSMLRLLQPSTLPQSIKQITLGGEGVSPDLVQKWAATTDLISAYGLSECTQLNMRHRLRLGKTSRVLGKPMDSTTCHILVPGSLELLPKLIAGELCLGGQQLASGYLNLPEKSQKVFIDNPFGKGRLYRTGDMALVREDGTIELIGRIDQQTKIDGQRVEPSESNFIIQLETGISHSAVVSAIVSERPVLVAFLVLEPGTDWTSIIRSLRIKISDQVPSYAVPKYWIQLPQLPLNVSGKVDLAHLRGIAEAMKAGDLITSSLGRLKESGPDILQTKNDVMVGQLVAKVVARTLSIKESSVNFDASFMELGGSSLDAIVLASELRKLQVHIAVADVLTSETLRDMVSCREEPTTALKISPQPFSLLPVNVDLEREGLHDAFPVTPMQESILADAIMGNASYIYQRVYRLNGVTPEQVKSALETVVARSATLRTTFVPWKRTFLQLVNQTSHLPWTYAKNELLKNFITRRAAVEMPIDAPLIRAAVVENQFLVIEMHHGLFDFWSSLFVVEDTISVLQKTAAVPRVSFNSYVSHLQLADSGKMKDFWASYLRSATSTIVKLEASETLGQDHRPFVLRSRISNTLDSMARSQGTTIGALAHAAWALALSTILDSTDVTFVAAFSGRDADIDGILSLDGPTLCTVPMTVHVDQKCSALDFTKSVQANMWNLTKYAHYGMRNALKSGSLMPNSFNTMVNVLVKLPDSQENAPLTPILTHGDNFTQYLTIELNEADLTNAKLLVPPSVNHASAQMLLDRFVNILEALVDLPGQSIELLTSATSQDYTPPDAMTETTLSQFGLAHAYFESSAASSPLKVAIQAADGRTITYSELNVQANQFASWLVAQGVIHGEMIPLFMEKSCETLISILGILKAGAAFTPLDPQNPHDRNLFIVQDVKAVRIISDQKHRLVAASFDLEVIILEDLDLQSYPEHNKSIMDLTPDSVVYAIYTSGSTGLPKGVLVQHSALSASTEGMIEATSVTSKWRALWVLNYIFDASYYDVFTIFAAGATLFLAPQDDLLSNLSKFLNDMMIEQVMLTPTITKLIAGGPAEVPKLKVLNVCGEKIDSNILRWARSIDVYNGQVVTPQKLHKTNMPNSYGPTEATILATVSRVKHDGNLNSIGLPLKFVDAVILSSEIGNLERMPHGQVGELCLRGHQLACGYLNRPDQTAAAFVQDIDGVPIYRTGDLARWSEDGTLECLGRKDYQIKLNGFRIELGEIENAILHTGEVEAAIVSVIEVHAKRQLVAFCIFRGDYLQGVTDPLPATSRLGRVNALILKLTTVAHYMVPAIVLPVRSFPLLPSGKANRKIMGSLVEAMDKREIRSYIPGDDTAGDDFVPISTKEEGFLRKVWAQILDEPEESIGANSAFLSLGGDSIAAINVAAMCRKLFFDISVSNVLSNSTLADQAAHLKPASRQVASIDVEHVIPQSIYQALDGCGIDCKETIEDIYPCSPGQIEFLTQGHKKQQFWNLTACRDLPQDFDLERWVQLTTDLTSKNQILRAMFLMADDSEPSSWYQIIHKHPVLDYEYIFCSTEADKLQNMENLRDSSFTFGKPNIKYRLLHVLADGSRTLCIKVDHGSYDGTLLRIFDDQFKALGRGDTAIPAVNSFKAFIDWVYRRDRDEEIRYWVSSLKTYVPHHNLPLDPETDRLKFTAVSVNVDQIATNFGVTTSTVFQAAYSIVVGKLCASNDVLVDNLLTGRNADVENPQTLNGTCATFLPFRTHLSGSQSTAQFLEHTQARFWDTTEHGTVGLTDIYKALGADRQTQSAKLLYCFQPFDPPSGQLAVDTMRWIVMAQSKVFMTINYALMVEVQKVSVGHRLKLQWDSRALGDEQINGFHDLFCNVLAEMGNDKHGQLESLLGISSDLNGIWSA